MIDTLMILLFPFLDFLPFQIPRYWLFREKLRIPMRWIILILMGITTAYSDVFFWANQNGIADSVTTLLRYGVMLFASLLSFFLIRDSLAKNMYTLLLMISYSFFVFGNANFIESHFFWDFSALHPYLVYNGVRLILLLITYPLFLRFLNRTIRKTLAIDDEAIWKSMWKIPLFSTLFGILYCTVTDLYAPATWQFLVSRYLMLGGSCYVSFVLLKILDASDQRTRLEAALRYADRTMAAQKKQYDSLSIHMEEVRRARHDLRQHLAVTQTYIERNDREGLRAYISQYQKTLPQETQAVYCRNEVVNAIISCYAELAAHQGARFDATVEYSDTAPISNTDAVVLLGNLLENAVEACTRQGKGEKWIRLHIQSAGSAIAVTLDNSFSGACKPGGGALLSSKRDGVGIGLRSIEEIAEKYNGFAEFQPDGNTFRASVFLNPSSVPQTQPGETSRTA
ncbi:sensor histidine kinase [Clostridium sp. D33t1_170424_F3]|uniref:sensor histidine kinase n=1 Tax=Clostridium sp. D33t1_170424_F3 TaxID=2787099 RepID=UPI0018A88698|nr:sensor histidine kinase [Clostridium sp. D33t1_170424_F3]